jgi:hypothetical protein
MSVGKVKVVAIGVILAATGMIVVIFSTVIGLLIAFTSHAAMMWMIGATFVAFGLALACMPAALERAKKQTGWENWR